MFIPQASHFLIPLLAPKFPMAGITPLCDIKEKEVIKTNNTWKNGRGEQRENIKKLFLMQKEKGKYI